MTFSTFHTNLVRNLPTNQVVNRDGMAYMSWANLLKNAGVPAHTCVTFDAKPGISILGGVVVAIDMQKPGSVVMQRTWLPVLDEENLSINAQAANGSALFMIQSAIARCRAKAVAMVTGYGLCLYSGYGANGQAFFKDIGLEEKHLGKKGSLASVRALSETKDVDGPEYLRWASALAAANLADPDFHWEVLFYPGANGESYPYMKAGAGYFVGVKTTYAGQDHIEILPMMSAFTYEILENPSPADWNRAVMRALAKGIATQTGYGLSLYSGDEPMLQGFEPPTEEEIQQLTQALASTTKTAAELLAWIGVGGEDLSILSRAQYQRLMAALGAQIQIQM